MSEVDLEDELREASAPGIDWGRSQLSNAPFSVNTSFEFSQALAARRV
jgi:hypothetical protein